MRVARVTARWVLPLGLVAAGLLLGIVGRTQTLVGFAIVLVVAGLFVWIGERLAGVSFEDNQPPRRHWPSAR